MKVTPPIFHLVGLITAIAGFWALFVLEGYEKAV